MATALLYPFYPPFSTVTGVIKVGVGTIINMHTFKSVLLSTFIDGEFGKWK